MPGHRLLTVLVIFSSSISFLFTAFISDELVSLTIVMFVP